MPEGESEGYRVQNLGISSLENFLMRTLNRYIRLFALAGAMVAPAAMIAAPRPQEASVQLRVYDRDHRDYHNWDDREDRSYRRYLEEQHRSYREYNRQHSREQRHYWRWRHTHPDRD
jgi:hypothetical protein